MSVYPRLYFVKSLLIIKLSTGRKIHLSKEVIAIAPCLRNRQEKLYQHRLIILSFLPARQWQVANQQERLRAPCKAARMLPPCCRRAFKLKNNPNLLFIFLVG